MTACGETSERTAALFHGAVAVMYAIMLVWHLMSTLRHIERARLDDAEEALRRLA